MALPTAPTGSLTYTKITSSNPSVGPDLFVSSASTSSIGTTYFLTTGGGVPLAVAYAPDQTSITWTNLAGDANGPAMLYAPIDSAGPHGVYLYPDGRLSSE